MPPNVLPSKVNVLPARLTPAGSAASMAAVSAWVMSVPEPNALSPAPRITTQRTPGSAPKAVTGEYGGGFLAAAVLALDGVAEVAHGQEWIEGYARAAGVARGVGALLGAVLVLATLEKLPLKDIASMLDMPVNTVKTHVRRARLRLVESYERRTRGQS